jgi:hypothetical protein
MKQQPRLLVASRKATNRLVFTSCNPYPSNGHTLVGSFLSILAAAEGAVLLAMADKVRTGSWPSYSREQTKLARFPLYEVMAPSENVIESDALIGNFASAERRPPLARNVNLRLSGHQHRRNTSRLIDAA